MTVDVAIAFAMIAICLVLVWLRVVCLECDLGKLQDTVDKLSMYSHEGVVRGARTAMYKELRDHPAEGVEDASDKMSMKLQEAAPREMEGIEYRRVKPGPAINLLFDESEMPALYRIETDEGFPVGNSEWSERKYGAKVLRITDLPVLPVPETKPINLILDGPPGPESGRFIEIETDDGKSIRLGGWHPRPDGLWSLRITELPVIEPKNLGR